jgi:hypothetical protein
MHMVVPPNAKRQSNDPPSPPLPPFSVVESPPSSLLKDSKALPQSRNPLIDRTSCRSRLRAKETRKICAQTFKRCLLELKALMLHSKCHSNGTFPSTLYTVRRRLARRDTWRSRGQLVRHNQMPASIMYHPPAAVRTIVLRRNLQPLQDAKTAKGMRARQHICHLDRSICPCSANSLATNIAY